jgi:hypothetical protein
MNRDLDPVGVEGFLIGLEVSQLGIKMEVDHGRT